MNANLSPDTLRTPRYASRRRGVGQVEIIVAAILMGILTGLLSTMSYQIQRVHKDAQNYQVAVYELSNQLRRLQTLPFEQVATEVTQLKLSDVAVARLENVTLKSQLVSDSLGTRVDIEIQWNRIGSADPVQMSIWIKTDADSTATVAAPNSEGQP